MSKMSVYSVPPAAPGVPSPHSGFVPPGAQAAPGATGSVYSSNSAPFSSSYGETPRQTVYSHQQQYAGGSAAPQEFQQLSSYSASNAHPPNSAVGAAAASQRHKQQATASFQSPMVSRLLRPRGRGLAVLQRHTEPHENSGCMHKLHAGAALLYAACIHAIDDACD